MSDQDPTAAPAAMPSHLAATYVPADRYGFLERAGARLRYACWNVPGTARGTVVVLTGRGEFIEKSATEVVGELLGRGYAVIAMDWRCQGLSDRALADRNKGHIDNFSTYMADLRLFLDKIVTPAGRSWRFAIPWGRTSSCASWRRTDRVRSRPASWCRR